MKSYIKVFKNIFQFKGRISRFDFCYYASMNFVPILLLVPIYIVTYFLFMIFGAMCDLTLDPPPAIPERTPMGDFCNTLHIVTSIFPYIFICCAFIFILLVFSAVIRRLHDVNLSGLWILICLIPIAGIIWLIILLCKRGTVGPNRFGEDPNPRRDSAQLECWEAKLPTPEASKGLENTITSNIGTIDENAVPKDITGLRLSKTKAMIGETVEAIISYSNGDIEDKEINVTLYVNGIAWRQIQVFMEANSSGEVTIPISFRYDGEYTVKSGDCTERITII